MNNFSSCHWSLVDVNIYSSEQLLSYVIPREQSVVIVQYNSRLRIKYSACTRRTLVKSTLYFLYTHPQLPARLSSRHRQILRFSALLHAMGNTFCAPSLNGTSAFGIRHLSTFGSLLRTTHSVHRCPTKQMVLQVQTTASAGTTTSPLPSLGM